MEVRLWSRVALVVVSAAMLQLGVFAQFRVWDVSADILLLVSVAAAMVAGSDRGALVGFGAGLLVDLQVRTPFGLSALSFCLAAYAVGRLEAMAVRTSRTTEMLTGFAGTAIGTVLFALLGTLVGLSAPSFGRVLLIAAVAGVWNALLTPLAVRVMRWAWQQPDRLRMAYR